MIIDPYTFVSPRLKGRKGYIPHVSEEDLNKGLQVPEKLEDFAPLCRIRSGDSFKPFRLHPWQIELDHLLETLSPNLIAIYKVRQIGVTEFMGVRSLHQACKNPAYSSAFLSIGGDESSKVAKRIRLLPAAMPDVEFSTNAVTDLAVKGGGNLYFRPSTDNAVRSLASIHDLFFDEAGFIKNINEMYGSAAPAQELVGEKAKTFFISTMPQEGKLCWFWSDIFARDNPLDTEEVVNQIRAGDLPPFYYWLDSNGALKVIIHWMADPIRSKIKNYLLQTKQKKKLTQEQLDREYDLWIPESGGSFFNMSLAKLLTTNGGWLTSPKPQRKYFVAVDPALGGDDFFTIQCWDFTHLSNIHLVEEKAFHFQQYFFNKRELIASIKNWNPKFVAIEKNNGGSIIADQIALVFPNIDVIQITIGNNNKRQICSRFSLAIEDGICSYPASWGGVSPHLVDNKRVPAEMESFSSVLLAAQPGKHDDKVMCAVNGFAGLASWLQDHPQHLNTATSQIQAIFG